MKRRDWDKYLEAYTPRKHEITEDTCTLLKNRYTPETQPGSTKTPRCDYRQANCKQKYQDLVKNNACAGRPRTCLL